MKPNRAVLARAAASTSEVTQQLYQAIAAIQTAAEAKLFFDDLCSPAERQAMADRWAVVGLVRAGVSYRDIQQQTGVSVTTVGRVARCFAAGAGGYALISQRLQD